MRAKIAAVIVVLLLVGAGVYFWWRSRHPPKKPGILSQLCETAAAIKTGGASQQTTFTASACAYVDKYLKSIVKAAPAIGEAIEHVPIGRGAADTVEVAARSSAAFLTGGLSETSAGKKAVGFVKSLNPF